MNENYRTIALAPRASKLLLKPIHKRQSYLDTELSTEQEGLRIGRGTRDQIANIKWIVEKPGINMNYTYVS